MRRGLIPVLGMFVLLSAAPRAWGEKALIAVNDPPAGAVERLRAHRIVVVRDMDRYLLAVATADERELLGTLGLGWTLLAPSIDDKTFYTVLVRGGAIDEIRSRATVLRYDGDEAVIEATPRDAEWIASRGHEIARVFLRPVRSAPREKPRFATKRIVVEPRITALVDSVSEAKITGYVQRLQDFQTRYCRRDSCQAAADWIKARFESFGIDSVSFQHFDPEIKDNVVAVLPGVKNPEKVVLVGGHFDSITGNHNNCPGADDNASGTACVIECARVLSPYRYDYTLVFVAFCGEEVGLVGSEAYASLAAQRGEEIVGAVCADMLGYLAPGDTLDLDIVSNASSAWLRDLVIDVGAAYVPGFSIVPGSIPGGAGSDHASFWANGYDAILLFEDSDDYSPYIHSSNDRVGISYNTPFLAVQSVRAAAALLATMAGPYHVAIDHTPLANMEATGSPIRVVAGISAAGTLNPDSLFVRYTVGSATTTVPLTPTGNGDEHEAYIAAQPPGVFVDYYLVAEDTDGNRVTSPSDAPAATHTFFVGSVTTLFADDMESESGWTVGAADDDAIEGIWERVVPNGTWFGPIPVQPDSDHTPDPGTFCFVTGNAPPGSGQRENEVHGGKTTLFSPAYDLSPYPNASVRYRRWYSNDTGFLDPEEWIADVSADGGSTWVRIETEPASDHAWRLVERRLADYISLTPEVVFRFVATDDSYPTVVEAGLDDFSIVMYEEVATSVAASLPAAAAHPALGRSAPNPFNPKTTISYVLPPGAATPIRLGIYDVTGRLVRTLVDGPRPAGRHAVIWDGRDESGGDAGSGVYFSRLVWQGGSEAKRMLLLR